MQTIDSLIEMWLLARVPGVALWLPEVGYLHVSRLEGSSNSSNSNSNSDFCAQGGHGVSGGSGVHGRKGGRRSDKVIVSGTQYCLVATSWADGLRVVDLMRHIEGAWGVTGDQSRQLYSDWLYNRLHGGVLAIYGVCDICVSTASVVTAASRATTGAAVTSVDARFEGRLNGASTCGVALTLLSPSLQPSSQSLQSRAPRSSSASRPLRASRASRAGSAQVRFYLALAIIVGVLALLFLAYLYLHYRGVISYDVRDLYDILNTLYSNAVSYFPL